MGIMRAIAAFPRLNELDIVCHGQAIRYEASGYGPDLSGAELSAVGYGLKLGVGLAVQNLYEWAPLYGSFRVVRVYACGERNSSLDYSYIDFATREAFCRRFAYILGARVVGCAESAIHLIADAPDDYTFTIGGLQFNPFDANRIDVLGWEGSAPVTVFEPGGTSRTLPPSDRLGR
jgi:hypothetical protein